MRIFEADGPIAQLNMANWITVLHSLLGNECQLNNKFSLKNKRHHTFIHRFDEAVVII